MKNYRARFPQNLALTKILQNFRKEAHTWLVQKGEHYTLEAVIVRQKPIIWQDFYQKLHEHARDRTGAGGGSGCIPSAPFASVNAKCETTTKHFYNSPLLNTFRNLHCFQKVPNQTRVKLCEGIYYFFHAPI